MQDPAGLCGHPDPAVRECPYPWPARPCAQLSIDATRRGENHSVRGLLVNACQEPFWHQGINMGEFDRAGLRATIEVNGTRYHFGSGAAWPSPTVAPPFPPGQVVGPGSPVAAEWVWNGTLATIGEDVSYVPAPAGEHALRIELARDASVNATSVIRIEARP